MENTVPLYKCLYGMELFKRHFSSIEAIDNCMRNLIGVYGEYHRSGSAIGAIDPNRILINLDNGELSGIVSIQIDEAFSGVDTIKFMPPEVIKGSGEFGEPQDNYCLALLLFSIRYFSHPFDGKRVYMSPAMAIDKARGIYGEPIFVFDILDGTNTVTTQTDMKLMQMWDGDKSNELKDLFTKCFTAGIANYDMRPSPDEWLAAIG